MQKIIFCSLITFLFTSPIPATLGVGALQDAKAPHIIHSGASPNYVSLQKAGHYF